MNLLFYFIVYHFIFKRISTHFLNHDEIQISLELTQALEIRQCVLVGDVKAEDLVLNIKQFSSVNTPVTHLNYDSLAGFVYETEGFNFYTGLIFKEQHFDDLEEISGFFQNLNSTYKMRNFVWLIFLGNETENIQMNNLIIPYDCEYIVTQSKNKTTYTLTEIYTVKETFFSLDFGTWDRESGLKDSNIGFYPRRSNFQKTEIKVLLLEYLERIHYLISTPILIQQAKDLLNSLASRLNLTIRPDIRESLIDIDETLQNSGDILIYPYPFDFDYINYDKLCPISKTTVSWYIKYPAVELKSDYYLQPFDATLWLGLLSAALLGTVLVLVSQKTRKRHLTDHLFLGLESFCGQCGNENIENASLRLICISLRFIALFSVGIYGAAITSFFAVEIFELPFKNLKEFLATGEYTLLKRSENDPILLVQAEIQNFTKFIPFEDYNDLYEEVCSGKYAIYDFDNELYKESLPCTIFKLPEDLTQFWHTFLLQQNSYFTTILSENLIRFYEIGFQMRFKMMQYHLTELVPEDSYDPIEMGQMTQVVTIPFIGVLLGMIIIGIEIGIRKLAKKKTSESMETAVPMRKISNRFRTYFE